MDCETFERDVLSQEKGWCPKCNLKTIKINVNTFACGNCEILIKPEENREIKEETKQ